MSNESNEMEPVQNADGAASQGGGEPVTPAPPHPLEPWLEPILALLQERTRYDFRQYKRSTLLRRIERRMGLAHARDAEHYVAMLRDEPEEVDSLYRDLLIGVTSFFREPEAWGVLQKRVIPKMLKDRPPESPIRVWIPGCATGEEAYTMAMVLTAVTQDLRRHTNIQIFASDIDEESLDIARAGIYPASIASEMPQEYLRRFFVKHNDTYHVVKPIRDSVVFALQNLIRDPPFSKLDMVSCRNLLIYLEPVLQERIFSLFHFALIEGGVLFLGNSETIGEHDDLFEEISKKWRIYRKIGPTQRGKVHITTLLTDPKKLDALTTTPSAPLARVDRVTDLIQQSLIAQFVPASVVINRKYEVLYVHGATAAYLQLPDGEPTNDLIAMAHESLRPKLRGAVHIAQQENRPVTVHGVHVPGELADISVSITVRPLRHAKLGEGLVVISFQHETVAPGERNDTPISDDSVVRQLETDLHTTRSELQSTIEELEVSNEELKASNEEVMSMNEELQSINEELETSKEELQSLNEELSTVNNQLRDKVEELESANDDMTNLLASSEIATLFLDTDFRVKRYSPAATQLFKLIPTDIGRPIGDVTTVLADDALLHDARQVLETLRPIETEVSGSGRWYMRRVLPYRTRTNQINGVVITFTDVTSSRRSRDELAIRATQQSIISEIGRRALSGEGLPTLLHTVAEAVRGTLAVELAYVAQLTSNPKQVLVQAGVGWDEGVVGQAKIDVTPGSLMATVLHGGRPVTFENLKQETRFKGCPLVYDHGVVSGIAAPIAGRERVFAVLGCYSRSPRRFDEQDVLFVTAMANVLGLAIEHKQADDALFEREEMYRAVGEAFNYGVWMTDREGKPTFISDSFLQMLGLSLTQAMEGAIFDCIHPEDVAAVRQAWESNVRAGKSWEREFRVHGTDGQWRTILARGKPVRDIAGNVVSWCGVNFDITDRKAAEVGLARLAAVVEASDDAIIGKSIDGIITSWNKGADEIFGYTAEEAIGRPLTMLVPPERHVEEEQILQSIRRGAAVQHFETKRLRKDGRLIDISLTVSPIRDGAGRVIGASKVARDITQRVQSELALRKAEDELRKLNQSLEAEVERRTVLHHESEQRFRTVYENSPLGIAILDPGGRFVHANPAVERMLGYTADELVGRMFTEVTHAADAKRESDLHAEVAAGSRERYVLTKRYIRKDGKHVWARLTASVVRDDKGKAQVLVRLIEDVTARRRAKRQLRQLQRQVAELAIQEQRRIGQELHDGLGQQLTAIGLMANSLRLKLQHREAPEVGSAAQLAEAIREAHRQVRRIARGLSPVEVDADGLRSALEELATTTTERCQVPCTFECSKPVPIADNEVATHLYRIAQESVSNAVKHAKATKIVIRLDSTDAIRLQIQDNGIGIAPTSASSGGMGIRIIRYRARVIGATLEIDSKPAHGTTITCTLGRDKP